jgi:hypothetical protein
LIKFGDFYNKSKILTILFIVKYEKITLFDEFLVLLGPINSRFFACSNEEKNKQKQQRVIALVLSLWFVPIKIFQPRAMCAVGSGLGAYPKGHPLKSGEAC